MRFRFFSAIVILAMAMTVGCGDDSALPAGAIGDSCDSHADCEGICLDPGNGQDLYCSDTCDPAGTDSCPAGYECLEVEFLGDVCVLTNEVLGELGDDCADGADCASGFCNSEVCSECEEAGDCPGAQTCADDTAGVGYFVCEGGDGALGDACTEGADCASGFCNSDVCSECEDAGDCTGNETCVDDTAGVGYFVCEDNTLGALGDACTAGTECVSGFCNSDLCSECETTGDCTGSETCVDDTAGVGYFVCEGSTLGALGDACIAGTECVSGFCNSDLCSECEGDGDCAGALGCVDDTGGVGYFVCEGGSAALGEDCTDGTDCTSGYCFDTPGPGSFVCSECEVEGDCTAPMTCNYEWGDDWATCGGSGELGDACSSGTECQSALCNTNLCSECEGDGDCTGGGTCTDDTSGVGYFVCAGGLGDDCDTGADCDSGFCYDPVWSMTNICSECEVDGDCTGQSCVMNWGDDWAACG